MELWAAGKYLLAVPGPGPARGCTESREGQWQEVVDQ